MRKFLCPENGLSLRLTAYMATLPCHWFPRQMTSEKRAQKFHSVSTQIWVVLLIG